MNEYEQGGNIRLEGTVEFKVRFMAITHNPGLPYAPVGAVHRFCPT